MSARPLAQRGASLVELMVGMAVGFLIVAAGSLALVALLHDTRRLGLEVRQMQELRTAIDLLARDLRRAGHWDAATTGIRAAGAGPAPINPFATDIAPLPGEAVSYRYAGANGRQAEQFGIRLRDATIELRLGANNWQALTDPAALEVTALTVTPNSQEVSLAGYCRLPCPANDAGCPPRQRRLGYTIDLQGRLPQGPAVVRALRTEVLVRNDVVLGACRP